MRVSRTLTLASEQIVEIAEHLEEHEEWQRRLGKPVGRGRRDGANRS
jgi:hypothetical protein